MQWDSEVIANSGDPRSFMLCENKHELKALLPTKPNFCDCCHNIGHFPCGVQRVKRFVNVHLHCIVSNLKRISKCRRCRPWKNVYGRPWFQQILSHRSQASRSTVLAELTTRIKPSSMASKVHQLCSTKTCFLSHSQRNFLLLPSLLFKATGFTLPQGLWQKRNNNVS